MARKLSEVTNVDCYTAAVEAVIQMIDGGESATFIQQQIPLSNSVILTLREMPSKDVNEFVSTIIARPSNKALTFKVDVSLVTKIVRSFNALEPKEVLEFVGKFTRHIANKKYLFPVYEKYFSYIKSSVSQCLDMDSNMPIGGGISIDLIREMAQLRASYLPAVLLGLFKYEVIKFQVNELSFSTVLAAYKAKTEGQETVLKLIRSGANLDFIKQHNGHIDVSPAFVKKWRKIYQVSQESEEVSVYDGCGIYKDFHSFIKQRISTLELYFLLHHKYKYRIDTLYLYINNALQEECEERCL